MENQFRSILVSLTALIFLIIGCATTTEVGRRVVRVEKEQMPGELEFIKAELIMNHDDQSIKIDARIRGYAKIKEMDVEEIHLRKKELKKGEQDKLFPMPKSWLNPFDLANSALHLVFLPTKAISSDNPMKDPNKVDIKDHYETDRGKGRIIKEEITVPAKDIPLSIEVNGYEKSLKSDQDGKAEFNLLPIINSFTIIPKQLRITCTAKIKDRSVREELLLSDREIQKIIQSETGRPKLAPYLLASVNFEKSKGILQAGNGDQLIVTVTNKGKGEAYQLKGIVKCPDQIFEPKEIFFGRLDPGKTKSAIVAFDSPKESPSKILPIEVYISEYNKYDPEPAETSLSIISRKRPKFAYSYQVIDDDSGNSIGNGDGRIQKGESVDILVTVKNIGEEPSQDTIAQISHTIYDDNIVLNVPEVNLGDIKPDEIKTGRLTMSVLRKFFPNQIKLHLILKETNFNTKLQEELAFAIDQAIRPKIMHLNQFMEVICDNARIYSGAGEDTSIIYHVNKGNIFKAVGQIGGWYQVLLGEQEKGWLKSDDLREPIKPKEISDTSAIKGPLITKIMENAPPTIVITLPENNQSTEAEVVSLKGGVVDSRGLKKVEIYLNGKIVNDFDITSIKFAEKKELQPYETEFNLNQVLKLVKGYNLIQVSATNLYGLTNTKEIFINQIKAQGKIWVVSIGIGKYQSPRIPALKYAINDAIAFVDYMKKYNQIQDDHIWLLTDEDATLRNLKSTLGDKIRKKAGKNDTVFIFYAGHGAPEVDPNSPDGDGLEKYILPNDTSPESLYSTALPMKEIREIFNRIIAERVVFITDACYSGATGGRTFSFKRHRSNVSENFLDRISQGKGRVILCACGANEPALEDDNLKHGVFTYYLLEGLKGAADADKNSYVTTDEIYNYLSTVIPHVTEHEQHPVKKGEVEGHIVIGKTGM
jgi:hypothetical protein